MWLVDRRRCVGVCEARVLFAAKASVMAIFSAPMTCVCCALQFGRFRFP